MKAVQPKAAVGWRSRVRQGEPSCRSRTAAIGSCVAQAPATAGSSTPQSTSWTRRPSTVVTPRSAASPVSKMPGLSGAGRRQESWLPGPRPRTQVRVSSPEDGLRRRWLLERRPQSPEHTFPQPQSIPDGTHRPNPAARIGTGPARCLCCVTRRRCRRPEGHSPEWSRTGRSRSSHRPCRLRPPVPVR